MLTVLLPAFDEIDNPYFWKTLDTIKLLEKQGLAIQVIVGATAGNDDTIPLLEKQKIKLIEVSTSKRADRYNKAFELSSGKKDDWLILHHPRSYLEIAAFSSLSSLPSWQKWGAFTHQFDNNHPLLLFTSWWSNYVRGDLKKIFYLDHCLFVRRETFEKSGGVPDREIFEDTILSHNLSILHSPVRLPWISTTSAIRFKKNGLWKQAFKNQTLKCRYYLQHCDREMNIEYEKGLGLNTKDSE
jgi:hypothetical protein